MQVFFTVVLVLNLLAEGMAAAALISGPQGISAAGQFPDGMWAMNYGFAALAIATAIFWVWPHRTNLAAVSAVLGLLITFHAVMTVALAIPGDQMGPVGLHAVMTLLTVTAFTQRHRWCNS